MHLKAFKRFGFGFIELLLHKMMQMLFNVLDFIIVICLSMKLDYFIDHRISFNRRVLNELNVPPIINEVLVEIEEHSECIVHLGLYSDASTLEIAEV